MQNYSYDYSASYSSSPASNVVSIIVAIIIIIAMWKIFTKMNIEGWKSIIPFYNYYTMFKALYGNGWRFLLLIIPIYGIYVSIKQDIDLAHAFGKSTAFGWGMAIIPVVFYSIVAFGDAEYQGTDYQK